jgi:uncharacterized protein YecE (DUF72 family)
MKKLSNAEEGTARLIEAARGLGEHLGPFLYQLPPHWRANPLRLEEFIALLPRTYQTAFEFRDPTWFQPDTVQDLHRILAKANCALVVAVGGALPTPLAIPTIGSFGYLRFHHGQHGIGFSEEELTFWAERLSVDATQGRELYIYFNNDPEGYAVRDALRLRKLLGL